MRLLQRGWGDGSDDGGLGVTSQSILKDAGQLRVSIANVLIAASKRYNVYSYKNSEVRLFRNYFYKRR